MTSHSWWLRRYPQAIASILIVAGVIGGLLGVSGLYLLRRAPRWSALLAKSRLLGLVRSRSQRVARLRLTLDERESAIRKSDEIIAELERKQADALDRRKADQELISQLNAESLDLTERLATYPDISGAARVVGDSVSHDHSEVELAALSARLKFRETELRDVEHDHERALEKVELLTAELKASQEAQRSLVAKIVSSECDVNHAVAHATSAHRRADGAVLRAADQMTDIAGLRAENDTLTNALIARGAKLAEFKSLTRRYAARVEELESIVRLISECQSLGGVDGIEIDHRKPGEASISLGSAMAEIADDERASKPH